MPAGGDVDEEDRPVLIDSFDLEVFTPPCDPGAERFSARARLHTDISELLPYLNATLRGAVYNPAVPALTWKKAGHNVAFHPCQIAISSIEDRQAAQLELRALIRLANSTWERRAEIAPDEETHHRPTPMALYQRLPKTNCKECGEATCFTFALKLAAGQLTLERCRPLFEPGHADDLAALRPTATDAGGTG